MESQAYFSGIREKIIEQLEAASDTVLVAVAWLTDRALFEALVACQRRGVAVSLAVLDDRLNRKSSIAWERLTALGGRLCWIPEGGKRAGSLHHKFCLIDNDTVINGSFNWTNRASKADENIVIMQGDPAFSAQFQEAFDRLLSKHGHDTEPETMPIDPAKLIGRLTVIEKLLELEDFDDIPVQARKLTYAKSRPEVAAVLDQLSQQDWQGALAGVKDLLTRGLAIAVYQDPRVEEWRWQVRVMESQVLALEAELADMQRQVHLFDHQQEQSIGELVRAYLDLKRRVLHEQHRRTDQDAERQEAEAADATFRQYEEARAALVSEPKPKLLDAQQQASLKLLYRQLAKRCHPDKMKDEDKAWAELMFKQLNEAHRNNDLDKVQKLKQVIERGPDAEGAYFALDQPDQLERRLKELAHALEQLSAQIATLGQSGAWRTLNVQADWSEWFRQQAEQLQAEIRRFQSELDESREELAI